MRWTCAPSSTSLATSAHQSHSWRTTKPGRTSRTTATSRASPQEPISWTTWLICTRQLKSLWSRFSKISHCYKREFDLQGFTHVCTAVKTVQRWLHQKGGESLHQVRDKQPPVKDPPWIRWLLGSPLGSSFNSLLWRARRGLNLKDLVRPEQGIWRHLSSAIKNATMNPANQSKLSGITVQTGSNVNIY